jgi:hypothetical protein
MAWKKSECKVSGLEAGGPKVSRTRIRSNLLIVGLPPRVTCHLRREDIFSISLLSPKRNDR